MTKIFEYFIIKPFRKLVFEITVLQNNYFYTKLFYFYSLLTKNNQSIYFNQDAFYLKKKNWKFSNKSIGLMTYHAGLKKRGEKLRSIYLLNNIKFKKNDIIIDCGANNGDFFLCFNKKIKYFGIEPSPNIFKNLKYNVKNQKLFNIAFWKDNKKKINFYLKDEYGDSSIIRMKNYTKKITVNCQTLDNFVKIINKKIKLIKIEAEGAEPEVVYGLKNQIKKIQYIVIDVGYERGNSQESTLVDCTNYLLKNNFRLIDFNSKTSRVIIMFKNNVLYK